MWFFICLSLHSDWLEGCFVCLFVCLGFENQRQLSPLKSVNLVLSIVLIFYYFYIHILLPEVLSTPEVQPEVE